MKHDISRDPGQDNTARQGKTVSVHFFFVLFCLENLYSACLLKQKNFQVFIPQKIHNKYMLKYFFGLFCPKKLRNARRRDS